MYRHCDAGNGTLPVGGPPGEREKRRHQGDACRASQQSEPADDPGLPEAPTLCGEKRCHGEEQEERFAVDRAEEQRGRGDGEEEHRVSRHVLTDEYTRNAMSSSVSGMMITRRDVVSFSWLISPAHSRCVSYGRTIARSMRTCASSSVG